MPDTTDDENLNHEGESELTDWLNRARADKSALEKAFTALWPEMEKLDHIWAQRLGTVGGSLASQPVTYQRVKTTFEYTLGDGIRWDPTWKHPGHFLVVFNRTLKLRHLDALRSPPNERRNMRNELVQQPGESDVIDRESGNEDSPSAVFDLKEMLRSNKVLQDAVWLIECEALLPDPDGFVYSAHHYIGCTHKDIQQLMNERGQRLTSEEIEAILNRVNDQLRKCLEAKRTGQG